MGFFAFGKKKKHAAFRKVLWRIEALRHCGDWRDDFCRGNARLWLQVFSVMMQGGLFGHMWERETRRTEEVRLFNRLGMKDESLCWFKKKLKKKKARDRHVLGIWHVLLKKKKEFLWPCFIWSAATFKTGKIKFAQVSFTKKAWFFWDLQLFNGQRACGGIYLKRFQLRCVSKKAIPAFSSSLNVQPWRGWH